MWCFDIVTQVRGWERTLNRVNETLDMWYTVQRKWMYLESIFVGAEDIRLQLPEEAKKFDAIDKSFKQARARKMEAKKFELSTVTLGGAFAPFFSELLRHD